MLLLHFSHRWGEHSDLVPTEYQTPSSAEKTCFCQTFLHRVFSAPQQSSGVWEEACHKLDRKFSLESNFLLCAHFSSGKKGKKIKSLLKDIHLGTLRCWLSWFPQQDPPLRFRCGYQPWEQAASGAGGRWVVATTRMTDWHLPVTSRESELRFRHVYTCGPHSGFEAAEAQIHWLHTHQVPWSHTGISVTPSQSQLLVFFAGFSRICDWLSATSSS